MRRVTFLLSFLLFLSCADAYTLVLKNGRQCSGDLISDDGPTVQFRDAATGAMLSLKKDQVDAAATTAVNAPAPEPASDRAAAHAKADEGRSLASLAAELRGQRTGKARVYTTADLTRAPQVSVSGTAESSAGLEPEAASKQDAPNEKRWRSEARALRKELESAQDHAAAAEAACDKARHRNQTAMQPLSRRPTELPRLLEQPSECRKMEEMNRRLSDSRNRFDDFEERARRAGVPWQWLE